MNSITGRGNDESQEEPAEAFLVRENSFLMRLLMLTPGRLPAPRASPYGCCFARVCTCMSLSLQVKITDAALCFPLHPPQFNSRRRHVNLCAARSEGVEMIYHCHINICLRSHIKLVDLLNKEEAGSTRGILQVSTTSLSPAASSVPCQV